MQFQTWLNQKGAKLVVDGVAGPKTRQAVFDVFRNRHADPVSQGELSFFAKSLGGTVRQIKAVAAVEAPRGGWDNTGLLACLYERHYFWKRIRIKIPLLSDPTPGGYTIDADKDGINDSWEKVVDAALGYNVEEAFESASWGKFQIMGAWWDKLGYASVLDFVYALSRNETAHYDALCRFIKTFGLTKAFQSIGADPESCRAFAKGYNGSAYAKHNYHGRIAEAYRKC